MKSDEKSIWTLAAQAHNAEADKRTLQKKLAASERRVEELERRLTDNQTSSEKTIRELSDRLSQEMNKVSEMMQQLVQYMMGNGDISLAGTIHDKVVEGIREEVRKEMRKEYQAVIDEKDAKIAYYESRDSHRDDNGDDPEIICPSHLSCAECQELQVSVRTLGLA